jgi:hypothetical protein
MVSVCDDGIKVMPLSQASKKGVESFESFADMFEAGYFRANRVIIGDRPEVAALAATSSLVKLAPDPLDLSGHAQKSVEIDVVPSLKVVLASSTPVRHNTFDTACRISEEIAAIADKSFHVEISGPGAEGLPLEDRMSLLAYLSFLSGRSAVIEPDQIFLNYLSRFGDPEAPVPYSDKNAPALDTLNVTLAKLRSPVYSLQSREVVSDAQTLGVKHLRRLRIGPLMGGGIEDFRQLAQALRGETIKKGLLLYVIPSNQATFAEALRRRYVHAIVEAGGRVGNVSSAPHLPALPSSEFELTTEMNASNSASYLASIQTIVQSLRTGKVTRRAFE